MLKNATALAAAAAVLTACTPVYVKAGQPCDKLGDEARGKNGGYYVCKDPKAGDTTGQLRWRAA